jgi:hypothetical protein
MTEENKSYESKFTEKQYALVELEMQVNNLSNLLGDVKNDLLSGHESSDYPTLRRQYMGILVKTKNLNPNFDCYPVKTDNSEKFCNKVEKYIDFLQGRGIYGFGKDEVVFWKIGSQ